MNNVFIFNLPNLKERKTVKPGKIKVAVLDLYNNEENQGIRCVKDILNETDCYHSDVSIEYDLFDLRHKQEIAGIDYDIYISSGGPGSPWEGEGTKWESDYFALLDKIIAHNSNVNSRKKYSFSICHSFQIMARYFKFASVVERHSESFGVMPVHKTGQGEGDVILNGLTDPFYAADFRKWQVIQPDEKVFRELNAKILCLEKIRPHVDYERALMAVRISDEIVGTQFHPEADASSMYYHFRKPERKKQVVDKYGEQKYTEMLQLLEDPEGIRLTRKSVLPAFLNDAVVKLKN